MIVVIKDDEPMKDSRDAKRKPRAAASKGKEKEASDIETLTHVIKNLTTKVSELKQRTINTSASRRPPRERHGILSSGSNHLTAKNSQSSSSVLLVESLQTMNFARFMKISTHKGLV